MVTFPLFWGARGGEPPVRGQLILRTPGGVFLHSHFTELAGTRSGVVAERGWNQADGLWEPRSSREGPAGLGQPGLCRAQASAS